MHRYCVSRWCQHTCVLVTTDGADAACANRSEASSETHKKKHKFPGENAGNRFHAIKRVDVNGFNYIVSFSRATS